MNKLILLLLLALVPSWVYAETEHTVQRGETLESIAKAYNVSVASLQEANPAASDLMYTGMILVIPDSPQGSQGYQPAPTPPTDYTDSTPQPQEFDYSNQASQQSTPYTNRQTVENADSEVSISDFGGTGVYYSAPFDSFKYGYYGLGWRFFSKYGFGGICSCNINYGLKGKNPPTKCDILVKFGPIYGYKITDYLVATAALRGFVCDYDYYNVDKGKFTKNTTGGITITPGLTLKINRLLVTFGYEIGWLHNSDKIYHNAEFSLGVCVNI